MRSRDSRTGLVLSGAAALGAYEAGVVHHIATEVAKSLGKEIRFDIISGTSAGGINAAALASAAADPAGGAGSLCEVWSNLVLGQLLRPSAVELLRIVLDVGGRTGRLGQALQARMGQGGLLDPGPLERLLSEKLPIGRIADSVERGLVQAVALTTTRIATGEAVVFYQAARDHPPWLAAHGLVPRPTTLGLSHALASAAIPLLLPAVAIDGDLFCDGGLRQVVPLSPAIHLGATHLLVIPPFPHIGTGGPEVEESRRKAVTSPIYLAGKALNAFFVDRVDADLTRLEQINHILEAGRRRFGPAFEADLNDELACLAGAGPLRRIQVLRIEPSRPLGTLAVEHVTSRDFARKEKGAAGTLLRCLADRDPSRSGDLLAYLLFDGTFAARLIELGRADARERHEDLCEIFAGPFTQSVAGSSRAAQ